MAVYVLLIVYYILCCTSIASKEHVCGKPLGTEFRLLEEDRIVAGYDIGYYRYPWYAALIRYSAVSCGGALIASKTVLTAAHCFKEFLKLANKRALSLESIYTVKLGVYNICEAEPTQKVFSVEKVIIHDQYMKKLPYYDICILKLIGNTDSFRVICLPPPMLKKRPPDGTVPGLGTLRYHGAMPCTVHEARLLIHNDTTCHVMLNNTGNDDSSIVNAFCAGYLQGGIDTCQGDSGGPLQSMNEDGDFVLIGIVSFGFRCADPGLLGMYTDVSQYIDWIKEKSGPDQPISIDSFVQTPTSGESAVSNSNQGANGRPGVVLGSGDDIGGQNHHHRRPNIIHIGRPYRRPVKVIIFKNNHLQLETQSLLHKPIVRYIIP